DDRLGLRAVEFDLALAEIGLGAVELAQEIVVPERAAELAVGDQLEPDLLLPLDDLLDLAIFDRAQRCSVDLALLALLARLFQSMGTQQAADVVGAEWRFGTLHD